MTLALAVLALGLVPPAPPGVVVNHSPAASKIYIGSPAIAVLPSGEYVASHDLFGPGSTRDTTLVFASADKGTTWARRATARGQWWSSLFVHDRDLYLMGTSKEYGACVIRRSADGGKTWTDPKDAKTGLLLADGMYHCAPVPVVVHGGRLWRAMEEYTGPKWGAFKAFVMSAPAAGADLLVAANWASTNRLAGNKALLKTGTFGGWLEGNVVVGPDDRVMNVLRVHQPDYDERAAVLGLNRNGDVTTLDPGGVIVPFPGGGKKFTIRYDPESKLYWALANYVPEAFRQPPRRPDRTRNTLALCWSADLKTWGVKRTVLSHPDPDRHGFQYADWLFDGADLIAVVRTAFDEPGGAQAHNAHDANYLTFHRIARFRENNSGDK